MSTSKIFSAVPVWIEAEIVTVEVYVRHKGIPSFALVGLPDAAVREARERIMAAIRTSGFQFPSAKTTINLAPADLKKEGSEFDLPMALGVLAEEDKFPKERFDEISARTLFAGELGLDGFLRPVRGALAMACAARDAGFKTFVLPRQNQEEAALVGGIEIIPCESLAQVLHWIGGNLEIAPYASEVLKQGEMPPPPAVDLADIEGNAVAKKALEVAAAGGHNLLLVGPPGAGKTMLARAMPGILPALEFEERLELAKIYSFTGALQSGGAMTALRPFRPVHHSASHIALVGGGSKALPGEVSLAHRGVLFLDEMAEFSRMALEALRQPMEDGEVVVSRAAGRFRYPSRFMLVGAANPCPCGWRGSREKECSCAPYQVHRYQRRLSGPILDRMDIHAEMSSTEFRDTVFGKKPDSKRESSADARSRVEAARSIQRRRLGPARLNAHMNLKEIKAYCKIEESAQHFLGGVMRQYALSARAYHRILKVARSLADLEAKASIGAAHISMAVQMRVLDRMKMDE